MPLLQFPEQQLALEVQALPRVLHVVLSAPHLPPVHVALQHWLFAVHATPSDVHAGKPHAPALHVPLQHAPFDAHWFPSDTHPPSVPKGLPASPMFTEPLLLPAPLLLPLLPAPLLPPLPLLLPAPLLLEPLLLPLLEVASPPSLMSGFALLPPHAAKAAPATGTQSRAPHRREVVRRKAMKPIAARCVPGGKAREICHEE